MKNRILISLAVIIILLAGCASSADVEKIDTVSVTNGGEPYEVELSRAVNLPISLSSAILIMEECYEFYNISLGEPELIDENWVFQWSPEYPDFEIKVNRKNGSVSIGLFG